MSTPLTPLRVEITYGEQVKITELADPRESFCQEFNAMGAEIGAVARPVTTTARRPDAETVEGYRQQGERLEHLLGNRITFVYSRGERIPGDATSRGHTLYGYITVKGDEDFVYLDCRKPLESQLADELYRVASLYLELAAKCRELAANCDRAGMVRQHGGDDAEAAAMLEGGAL